MEGGALAVMLADAHQREFLQLCQACQAVVCCRVSPIQKVGAPQQQHALSDSGHATAASESCLIMALSYRQVIHSATGATMKQDL